VKCTQVQQSGPGADALGHEIRAVYRTWIVREVQTDLAGHVREPGRPIVTHSFRLADGGWCASREEDKNQNEGPG
jgi:hypothetical protein